MTWLRSSATPKNDRCSVHVVSLRLGRCDPRPSPEGDRQLTAETGLVKRVVELRPWRSYRKATSRVGGTGATINAQKFRSLIASKGDQHMTPGEQGGGTNELRYSAAPKGGRHQNLGF